MPKRIQTNSFFPSFAINCNVIHVDGGGDDVDDDDDDLDRVAQGKDEAEDVPTQLWLLLPADLMVSILRMA